MMQRYKKQETGKMEAYSFNKNIRLSSIQCHKIGQPYKNMTMHDLQPVVLFITIF
jgi:hypothetical protein